MANMASRKRSRARPRSRLRRDAAVRPRDHDQYLHARGALRRRDAKRRVEPRRARRTARAAPRTAPETKDVEFEKCYSARLSLNDMEGNASPRGCHVCASAPRARSLALALTRADLSRVSPKRSARSLPRDFSSRRCFVGLPARPGFGDFVAIAGWRYLQKMSREVIAHDVTLTINPRFFPSTSATGCLFHFISRDSYFIERISLSALSTTRNFIFHESPGYPIVKLGCC